jgi:Na+/alanine symporter
MFFFWVGILIPAVLLIFVGQAILLDHKDLFDSFSKSYDTARENIMDVLALLFIFLVILAIVRVVPVLGMVVALVLMCYSAVTVTVLYRSKGIPQKVRPKKAKPAPTT